MKNNKIKYIRRFERFGATIYEVYYISGWWRGYDDKTLTETAKRFIATHEGIYKTNTSYGEYILYTYRKGAKIL